MAVVRIILDNGFFIAYNDYDASVKNKIGHLLIYVLNA